MPPQEKNGTGLNTIAIVFAIAMQLGILIWGLAIMHASVGYNRDQLQEINRKLNAEVREAHTRLNTAEKELAILKSIIEITNRKK